MRIDAAIRSKHGIALQPKGGALCRGRGMPDGQGDADAGTDPSPAGRLGLGNTALPGNAAVGVVGVLLVEL